MVNTEIGGSLTHFRDAVSAPATPNHGQEAAGESQEYLQSRRRAEERAAKAAPTGVIRQIHQQLAQAYGDRLCNSGEAE